MDLKKVEEDPRQGLKKRKQRQKIGEERKVSKARS